MSKAVSILELISYIKLKFAHCFPNYRKKYAYITPHNNNDNKNNNNNNNDNDDDDDDNNNCNSYGANSM